MTRNYSIDFVKCLAIFFVVIIHTEPFNDISVMGVNGSYINFILDTFARFAVPFFFIVAGFLFGQKIKQSENPNIYFKKYILKLFKLFVCWQIFYLLYDLVFISLMSVVKGMNIKLELLNYLSTLNILKLLYYGEGTSGSHLWYLAALVWCILIIFLCRNKVINLLVFSLVLYLVGLFGQSYSGIIHLPIQTRDALFFGLLYTTLGFFFANKYEYIMSRVVWRPKSYLYLFLGFSFLQLLERAALLKLFNGYLGDYFISTIFLTVCLFLFVINCPQLGKNSFFVKIGEKSVGIYVIHVFFINTALRCIGLLEIDNVLKTVFWSLLFTPMVFIVSYLSYRVLQSIKQVIIFNSRRLRLPTKKVI